MPAAPYAKLLMIIDGGAPVSGGQLIGGSNTVQLYGESTSHWRTQTWEIYSYPEGFACPVGWTDLNGVYRSDAVTPPEFDVPDAATLWGKYLFRLTVNNGLIDGIYHGTDDPQPMVDETSGVVVESPNYNLRGVAFGESNQFDNSRQWAGELQKTIKKIDEIVGGGGGSGSNLGAGTVQVFKDTSGGVLRHRTMRLGTTQSPSLSQDANEILLRPVKPGAYNVIDYGALEWDRSDPAGAPDSAPAFRAAAAAAAAVGYGAEVFVPPTSAATKAYFFKTADPADATGTCAVQNGRAVTFKGVAQFGGFLCSIKTVGLLTAFFNKFDVTTGGAAYAAYERLAIESTVPTLAELPYWQNNHTYVIGDVVRKTNDHRQYFVCVFGGLSHLTTEPFGITDPTSINWPEPPVAMDGTRIIDGPDTLRWEPRIHAAILSNARMHVESIFSTGFFGAVIHIQAGGGQWAYTTNATKCSIYGIEAYQPGVGLVIAGSDAQVFSFEHLNFLSPGRAVNHRLPPQGPLDDSFGGHGVYCHSFYGGKIDCVHSENHTGRGLVCDGVAGFDTLVISSHFEGAIDGLPSLAVQPTLLCQVVCPQGFTSNSTFSSPGVYDDTGWSAKNIFVRIRRPSAPDYGLYFGLDIQNDFRGFTASTTDDGANQYLNLLSYGHPSDVRGFYMRTYGNQNRQHFGWHSSAFSYPDPGPGWDGHQEGLLIGDPAAAPFFVGEHAALANRKLRKGKRKAGDRFLKGLATRGRFNQEVQLTTGWAAPAWAATSGVVVANTTYGTMPTTCEPTATVGQTGSKVFAATTLGTGVTHSVEPNWATATVAGDTVAETAGGVVWTLLGFRTATGFSEKIETLHTSHTPQTTDLWRDSSETTTAAAKAEGIARRKTIRTTVNTADQVLDDGTTWNEEDLAIPADGAAYVQITALGKRAGATGAGTVTWVGTFENNGGTVTSATGGTYTADVTDANGMASAGNLHISGDKVRPRVTPGNFNIDWTVISVHVRRLAP